MNERNWLPLNLSIDRQKEKSSNRKEVCCNGIPATPLDPKVGSTIFSQQKVVMSRPIVEDGLIRLSANIPRQVGGTVQLEWSINDPKIKETGVVA